MLRRMAGNVSIEQDAADNCCQPFKKRCPERIDGIVGLIMALAIDRDTEEEAVPKKEIDMPSWQ